MRSLALALLIAATLVAPPARAAGRASAPFDSTLFRSFSVIEPYRSLMPSGRWNALDSIARARFDAVVARRERDSLAVGRALDEVIETAALAGRGREAIVLAQAERVLALHTAQPGPDSLLLARTLRAMGDVQRRRRNFAQAEALLQRAMAILDHALAPNDPEIGITARLLVTIGVNFGGRQYPELAQRAVDNALANYGPDDLRTLMSYSALAGVQNTLGDQVHALVTLERVYAGMERRFGSDHPDVARSRFNVAVVAMRIGDYVRALELLERTLALESARPVVDSTRVANTFGATIEVLNDLGDYEGAEALDARFGALHDATFGIGDGDRYRCMLERARMQVGLGRPAGAVALFDSAAANEAQLNDSLSALPVLFQRAGALRAAGDSAGALRGIELAGRLAERDTSRAASFYEMALLWARCLNDAGRPAEAVQRLEPALVACETKLGARNPIRAKLLLERARALAAAGDPRAFDTARDAAELTAELLRTASRGFPERLALLYARGSGLGLDPLLGLAAAGRLDAAQRRVALQRVIEARSLVLDEVARRQQLARHAADPRARARLDSLAEARGVLARWLVRADVDPQLDSLRRDASARAERLERGLAEFGVPRAAADGADALAALGPADALVSFIEYAAPTAGARSERRLLAFVTRADRAPDVVALGRARTIDALVSRWREDVALGVGPRADGVLAERRARTSGAALRARVWDPLAARLAGATRVVLVADGALHLVDFAALPAARGGWLAESGPLLARLGAERDLGAGPDTVTAGETLLALGGADFDRASDAPAAAGALRGAGVVCEAFRDVRFAALPGTRLEAGDVAARWRAHGWPALELTGDDAGEARLKAAAPACGVLHLATHGFFLGSDCVRESPASRGIGGLAPADASAASGATPGRTSALRLAGLALAGANHREDAAGGDDGVLTAEEIASLDLSRVREVVLSACDSGVGDIAEGEGVLGLQRAFRLAGARALVMSLWPVDDRATREWMAAYYDARLSRGDGVAAAVRAAQRARLAALRAAHRPAPPAAWAGFVPLGD